MLPPFCPSPEVLPAQGHDVDFSEGVQISVKVCSSAGVRWWGVTAQKSFKAIRQRSLATGNMS